MNAYISDKMSEEGEMGVEREGNIHFYNWKWD
jgi:hypothetical protein